MPLFPRHRSRLARGGLTRQALLPPPIAQTPEPAPTPFEFSDPKVPTYGTPIQSGAAGDGMQVLVGWE